MNGAKHWAQSRTILVGVLTIVAAILTDPSIAAVLPVEWAPRILAISGVVAIVLRALTGQPLRR